MTKLPPRTADGRARLEGILRTSFRGSFVTPEKILIPLSDGLRQLERLFDALGNYFDDERWKDAALMVDLAIRELRKLPPAAAAGRVINEARELEDAKTAPCGAPASEPVLHRASRRKGLLMVKNPLAVLRNRQR